MSSGLLTAPDSGMTAGNCNAVRPAAGGGVAAEAITHSEAQQVHQLLADELGEAQAAADFKSKCQQVFRYAALALLLRFIVIVACDIKSAQHCYHRIKTRGERG